MGKGGGARKPPGEPLRPSLPPQPPDPEPLEHEGEAEAEAEAELRGNLKAVTVYLPNELHWQLKQEALDRSRAGENCSVSKLIVEALRSRMRLIDHHPREE